MTACHQLQIQGSRHFTVRHSLSRMADIAVENLRNRQEAASLDLAVPPEMHQV